MSNTELTTKTRSRTARPSRYTVLFINDEFTPMDFVIQIMMKIFGQSVEEAERITMEIHRNGRGNVGLYSYEVAETKVAQAMETAKAYEFPLTCSPEKA